MIVNFSISNFLSFGYSETLTPCIDMVPTKPRNKINHIIEEYNLLKSAVYFGGNGAGKSNIIKGLGFLKRFITEEYLPTPNDGYYCRCKEENKKRPIRFRIEVMTSKSSPISSIIDYKTKSNILSDTEYTYIKSYTHSNKHYGYELELNYEGDDIPYYISYEKLYTIKYGREKIIFENKNKPYKENNDLLIETKILEHMLKNQERVYQENILMIESCSKELEIMSKKMNMCSRTLNEYLDQLDQDKLIVDENISKYTLEYYNNQCDPSVFEFNISSYIKYRDLLRQYEELSEQKKDMTYKLNQTRSKNNETRLQIDELSKKLLISKKKISESPFSTHNSRISEIWPIYEEDITYENTFECEKEYVKQDFYNWFKNTLNLIGIGGQILPPTGFRNIEKINYLLTLFDANIESVSKKSVISKKEILEMIEKINPSDLKKVTSLISKATPGVEFIQLIPGGSDIYEFKYADNKIKLSKLVTKHHDNTTHQLIEESDGTRRLIELMTALVEPSSDKVYVIDELDRRLHPLITKNFIDIFFENKSNKVQMIITTHESRLATTDIFRSDEINLVGHDKNNNTIITNAKDALGTYNKRFDKLYLDDLLIGGVPEIKQN